MKWRTNEDQWIKTEYNAQETHTGKTKQEVTEHEGSLITETKSTATHENNEAQTTNSGAKKISKINKNQKSKARKTRAYDS